MSNVLVDSSVLLDVLGGNGPWRQWSERALASAAETARLVINPIIYAEVSVRYSRIEELDVAMRPDLFAREPIPYRAAFLAGKVFLLYRRRGGARSAPLPDFFIGAHAAVVNYRLLTRDPRRYRTFFPDLAVMAP